MQNPGWASIQNTNAVIRDPATGQPTGKLDELAAESVGDAAFAAANPTFFTPQNLVKGLGDGGKLARRVGVTTATEGEDPLLVHPIDLKDVPVTATVLGGKVFLNN